jgi:hypothetical protein
MKYLIILILLMTALLAYPKFAGAVTETDMTASLIKVTAMIGNPAANIPSTQNSITTKIAATTILTEACAN